MNRDPDPVPSASLTRRDFLALSSLAAAGVLTGCATNPVTGRRQVMFFGRSTEREWDQGASPHQFSADYGAVQDAALNAYLGEITEAIAPHAHRGGMTYSCRCVNASYINAYTFPAGSMATTRGILLNLENEDQLAALIGHEMAHVNARHTAQAMTKNLIITGTVVLVALALEAGADDEKYTPWIMGLGAVGAGLMLARYSRSHERQADRVGLDYMAAAGYNPEGMVGLMAMLKDLQGEKPWLVLRMFSSHPWSGDRYEAAVVRAATRHAAARQLPLRRERYMDMTASVRRARDVIEAIQKGDDELDAEKITAAQGHYADALRAGPDDYEALLKLANVRMLQKKPAEALGLADRARAVYPAEPQARHAAGLAHLELRRYEEALARFDEYAGTLPGNPYNTYYRGRANDGMGRRLDAANLYREFLDDVDSGTEAAHAKQRLEEWNMLEEQVADRPG